MFWATDVKKLFVLFSLTTFVFFYFLFAVFLVGALALLTHIGVVVASRVVPVKLLVGFCLEADLASFHLLALRSLLGLKLADDIRSLLDKEVALIFENLLT